MDAGDARPLSSAAKAAAYRDMLDLINTRHIKGALEDGNGGVCLVGAANRVGRAFGPQASAELQREVRDELLSRSPMLRTAVELAERAKERNVDHRFTDQPLTALSSDGGLALVEMWNDVPWRRTRTVAKVLADLAHEYGDRAREELIEELRWALADLRTQQSALKARIVELEAENERLREEVSFWKAAWNGHRARVGAKQLRAASAELEQIDDDLNEVFANLVREGVAV